MKRRTVLTGEAERTGERRWTQAGIPRQEAAPTSADVKYSPVLSQVKIKECQEQQRSGGVEQSEGRTKKGRERPAAKHSRSPHHPQGFHEACGSLHSRPMARQQQQQRGAAFKASGKCGTKSAC